MNEIDTPALRNCPTCKALIASGTRHCIACGWRYIPSEAEQIRLGTLKPHNKLEPAEGSDVISVLRTFRLTLPANAIEWRVPRTLDGEPLRGSHPVFDGGITVLLTDGILAWCAVGIPEPGCPVFLGHLANVELDEAEPQVRPLTPRQIKLRNLANED